MKIFGFVKESVFCRINNFIRFHKRKFVELYFNEQSRVVFQQTIKSVKQDHKLLMLMEMSLCFFHLVLKQVNVVVVVKISTIRMQKFVYLML